MRRPTATVINGLLFAKPHITSGLICRLAPSSRAKHVIVLAQLPDANGPGFENLRARVETALKLNAESPSVEFKTGASWSTLQIAITRTVLAMSNLIDGGLIIVGQPEDPSLPHGVNDKDLASFDPDIMHDQFDAYASPRAIVSIALVSIADQKYVAIQVSEFEELPIVCKKDCQPGLKLKAGSLYIRPFEGRPRSIAVRNAEQMRGVLELGVDKGIANFEARARRRGYTPRGDDDNYKRELGGLG